MARKKEVLLIGRSNVGKSSIFRILTNQKVPIGKKPGTTTAFKRHEFPKYILVDFPGLGTRMSKRSKASIDKVQKRLIKYIEENANPNTRVVQFAIFIVDISNFKRIVEKWDDIQIPLDIETFNFLNEFKLDPLLIVNKIDKIPEKELDQNLNFIASKLGNSENWKEAKNIIPISAKKKTGIRFLQSKIRERVKLFK